MVDLPCGRVVQGCHKPEREFAAEKAILRFQVAQIDAQSEIPLSFFRGISDVIFWRG